jgi:hypothetical protein
MASESIKSFDQDTSKMDIDDFDLFEVEVIDTSLSTALPQTGASCQASCGWSCSSCWTAPTNT